MANDLKTRLSSDTPKWFKSIIRICASLAAVGIGLLTVESKVPGFEMPAVIETMAQWFIVAGIVGGIIAKTAQNNE